MSIRDPYTKLVLIAGIFIFVCAVLAAAASAATPAFTAHKNGTNQTVANDTDTLLTWSTEGFDTNNNFATNRFTPTVAGKYLIVVSVHCQQAGYCMPAIRKNGTTIVARAQVMERTVGQTPSVTAIVDMNGSTDYVEAMATSSGTVIAGTIERTYFSGSQIDGAGSGSSQWIDGTAGAIYYNGGNVGIGTPTPAASAKLDVSSTTQGFLPPRLTKAQRNAISSPAEGLMIYQTADKRIEWYNGSNWVTFSGNLIATNLDGTSSTTAGRSCKELFDGGFSTGNALYWLDPDGNGAVSPFQGYCDMTNGGWTLVTRQLSTVAASTHEVAAAVGTLTGPTQGTVAKLSDSVINAIAANSAAPVYKIDCATRVNYYILPSSFSATATTWSGIQVSVVSETSGFFTINSNYASCSKGPHSCDNSSSSGWGANGGRNPGALYGAGAGGFGVTNGCSYSNSTASASSWSSGSGTTWVK